MQKSQLIITPKITEKQLATRIDALAEDIAIDYEDLDVVFVCILKGSVIFMTDLIRAIAGKPRDVRLITEFMMVSSYNGTTQSSGNIRVLLDMRTDIRGKHVIIVENIVDTGLTMNHLVRLLQQRGPKSIRICTLLQKGTPKLDVPLDYVGFAIDPYEFVVGYGLDYEERYRELPFVGVVDPSD